MTLLYDSFRSELLFSVTVELFSGFVLRILDLVPTRKEKEKQKKKQKWLLLREEEEEYFRPLRLPRLCVYDEYVFCDRIDCVGV